MLPRIDSRNSQKREWEEPVPVQQLMYNDEGALPSQTEFQREAELIRVQSGHLAMLNYLFDLCVSGKYILKVGDEGKILDHMGLISI